MHYGYIGLGNLGGHLAVSLLQAGHRVTVYDRNPALAERHAALGATIAPSVSALAEQVDHVFTCLPNPAVSEAVLAELMTGLKPGATWIENSTLGRDDVLRLAGLARIGQVRLLEAPVTGGVHLAARGEITVLLGGDQDLVDLHRPALSVIGKRLFHMGPLGSAAIIKVITNMLAFIHLKATSEALMLAKRGGLDLGQAWQAIAASSGNSFVHETEGALILNGSYDIAFNIDLALKDLGFALGFGKEFGVPLDLASITNQTYIAARAAYGGAAQSPMIAKLLEDLLGTDLRAEGFPARLE
ncbi:NAD(P)-dependent oxidoreductase [Tabrizicola sp.]|uniref:NAD(P)-dependent oxidoreductase n=1 Tax=Tabrizicola sp. TaxID=2005166 RepID=UPI001A494DA3|nr:NAD(P)-dependent oxidoreductase [Tabrizicola sp.]MBL9072642.1 NAD(P)-dependent oxidoreductase [Tabrizicola sp.]